MKNEYSLKPPKTIFKSLNQVIAGDKDAIFALQDSKPRITINYNLDSILPEMVWHKNYTEQGVDLKQRVNY